MTRSGKIIWSIATSVVGILTTGATAQAVPVVPNFTQGSMTSHTETTSKVTETINSMDYNTGYSYSVTGSGITTSGSLTPGTGSNNVTIDGVTSSWTGINNRPTFTQTTPGAAFQFTETYQGPVLSQQTIIQRVTEVTSVTDTTSIFQQ
ncbi:hypothetical protein LIS091010_159 [Synechococcus phage S-RIM2]|uniref:Gp166 n=1 Tax=Synechococcus phage S-RIM2 TaxID=687800 RepID=A0A1D7RC12_9CAUD|nr:hypothetical protein LIS091010_159 [Synechococcus phage S-RIM2]